MDLNLELHRTLHDVAYGWASTVGRQVGVTVTDVVTAYPGALWIETDPSTAGDDAQRLADRLSAALAEQAQRSPLTDAGWQVVVVTCEDSQVVDAEVTSGG